MKYVVIGTILAALAGSSVFLYQRRKKSKEKISGKRPNEVFT